VVVVVVLVVLELEDYLVELVVLVEEELVERGIAQV
tara:strand:+ start:378 stop:485 length:108 start_codon:yes stop_codon:yes gene_type:complete